MAFWARLQTGLGDAGPSRLKERDDPQQSKPATPKNEGVRRPPQANQERRTNHQTQQFERWPLGPPRPIEPAGPMLIDKLFLLEHVGFPFWLQAAHRPHNGDPRPADGN